MTVELSDKAKEVLAEKGYDPAYGARPLKRVIQKLLQDPLSMQIIDEKIVEGDDITVEVNGDGQTFTFRTKRGN